MRVFSVQFSVPEQHSHIGLGYDFTEDNKHAVLQAPDLPVRVHGD